MSISLTKGQKLSLKKEDGGNLKKVTFGLGWDVAKSSSFIGKLFSLGGEKIDLDASCGMFDNKKKIVDTVFFKKLKSKDGAIVHTGDNLTGEGDGDDEQIVVDLRRVSAKITNIIFTVNSYSGQSFDKIENAYVRLVDNSNDKEMARFDLSCQGEHTALIMARLHREKDSKEWKMIALGSTTNGKTIQELKSVMQTHL